MGPRRGAPEPEQGYPPPPMAGKSKHTEPHLRPLALMSAAALLGACALTQSSCGGAGASSGPPPVALPGSFDKEAAWADMEAIVGFGPRPVQSAALENLRQWFETELTGLGLVPVREEFQEAETPIGLVRFANVYADLVADPALPWIVIGAHFDTCLEPAGFVGANDGASAPSVVLEIARLLRESDPRPVNYRFLFLDGEEAIEDWRHPDFVDHTYGSRHHVAQLKADPELFDQIGMFLLLDLVGDANLNLFRETNSTRELLEMVFDAAHEIGLGAYVGGSRMEIRDDHLEFLAEGIPSVDLIDFNYGSRNRYWHTLDDTLENCSPDSLEVTGRIVQAALPRLESWVIASKSE